MRGEATTAGAGTHTAILQLFDLLEPYFRLLVVEDRCDAGAGAHADIDPDVLLRFCRALEDPRVKRLADKGGRRFGLGPRLVVSRGAAA